MSPVCIVCTTLLEFRWNTVTLRGRRVRSGGVYREARLYQDLISAPRAARIIPSYQHSCSSFNLHGNEMIS